MELSPVRYACRVGGVVLVGAALVASARAWPDPLSRGAAPPAFDYEVGWTGNSQALHIWRDFGPKPGAFIRVPLHGSGRVLWRGGTPPPLSDPPGPPALSPNGKLLATRSEFNLMVRSAATGKQVFQTNDHSIGSPIAWSADSRRVAALTSLDSGTLRVVGLDGRSRSFPHVLCNDAPVWSPNGRWIACMRYRRPCGGLSICSGPIDVNLVPAAGGRVRVVARGRGGRPSWSPDSRYMALGSATGGAWRYDVYPVKPAGRLGSRVQIYTPGESGLPFNWTRAGRLVAAISNWAPVGRFLRANHARLGYLSPNRNWVTASVPAGQPCGRQGIWLVSTRTGAARHVSWSCW